MKKQSKQTLRSNFSHKEYANIEKEFHVVTNHVNNVVDFIDKNIFSEISLENFLDIGIGPGYITQKLLEKFKRGTGVDPNECYSYNYEKLKKNQKFNFFIGNFENIDFFEQFNFILCSHVLYHIPQEDWEKFIVKIISLLKPKKSLALVVIVAPRGKFHKLCDKINSDYSNSRRLKQTLDLLKLNYKITHIVSNYTHDNHSKMTNLIRMFAIDDCFLPKEYKQLSTENVTRIEKLISKFINDCYDTKRKTYTLLIEEDYFLIRP